MKKLLAFVVACSMARGQSLDVKALELHHVVAAAATYQGRQAVRLQDAAPNSDVQRLAIISGTNCENGTIDVDLAGDTDAHADPGFRGFVGIAFRVVGGGAQYECIYLRPKNGRSDDQLQRNHSTQYISVPGFPWEKLRSQTPGKYESYVDLVPGRWTHVRIAISGITARLFVDAAEQPVLVVNDLKQKVGSGAVALWIGPGTVAHFDGLRIEQKY